MRPRDSPAADLAVGGFQPFSASDWPGKLAAVVFTQGCALRCGYCHNPHLIPRGPGSVGFAAVLEALSARRHLLDGVVFSGGEPCLQPALPAAVAAVRALGLAAGLHTAGTHPAMLSRVLPDLCWVGLDVKAGPADLAAVTGADGWRRTMQSLDLLNASGSSFEVRTSWSPGLFGEEALLSLARQLATRGVRAFALQRLRTMRGGRWLPGPAPGAATLAALAGLFPRFIVR